MVSPEITLSILIITHNQLTLLKRCLCSVLAQKLSVPFEVVISDDRSEDGTAEYVRELSLYFHNLHIDNLLSIVYTRCNSNECDPSNVSERCGWNKLNAYKHARGKYFVNIDADDYLRCDDIYQCQLDMLMSHSECSMCMQDVWQVKDCDPVEIGHRWPSSGKLTNGQVLSVREIISDYRALNQCYMIRRHPEFDVEKLYGKFFDDTIITIHHLQFGPCVWINRADYVWVNYTNSITGTLKGNDELVEYSLLPLHHIKFIPCFAGLFMCDAVRQLVHFYKILFKNKFDFNLSDRTLAGFKKENGFIYEKLSYGFNCFDVLKVIYIRFILLLTSKFNFKSPRLYKYIYALNTNSKRANKIDRKYWLIN